MINELFFTEKVKVNTLVPRVNNPRKIKAEEKRKLWERIQKFGLISIPVRDADGQLLGGKQRCELLTQYGLGEIEIDCRTAVRKLTDAELREVMMIENSHAGEWDLQKLREEFDSFIDLSEFGIMMEELDAELNEMTEEPEPEMPIVAKFSEKYTAFIIVCTNEIDENHVAEKLGIRQEKCYKSSKIGTSHIVPAKRFIAQTQQG
ncbi:hypothetical protein LAG90_15680 [Marinilongibacter aquaticus]|uniref:hypothetical protein n=1 Tax=Marinilongibacter aquaticus TaxID=2975157 RepID=UPI0021BDCDF4|nr:hypothetical protein [Marinilongibacter aquaticus]UBM58244.1 hypothetical protein LAG90_15680 [Marinilongibacter aquaticus]